MATVGKTVIITGKNIAIFCQYFNSNWICFDFKVDTLYGYVYKQWHVVDDLGI